MRNILTLVSVLALALPVAAQSDFEFHRAGKADGGIGFTPEVVPLRGVDRLRLGGDSSEFLAEPTRGDCSGNGSDYCGAPHNGATGGGTAFAPGHASGGGSAAFDPQRG